MSRHSSHLCPPALVVACSFRRNIFSCFLLEYCHDIIWQCRDIVLLRLSSLCHDMSVLGHDIKCCNATCHFIPLLNYIGTLISLSQKNFLSFSLTLCCDISLKRRNIKYTIATVFCYLLFIFCRDIVFFYHDIILCFQLLTLLQHSLLC